MYIIASAFKNMGPNIQVLTTPIPTPPLEQIFSLMTKRSLVFNEHVYKRQQ